MWLFHIYSHTWLTLSNSSSTPGSWKWSLKALGRHPRGHLPNAGDLWVYLLISSSGHRVLKPLMWSVSSVTLQDQCCPEFTDTERDRKPKSLTGSDQILVCQKDSVKNTSQVSPGSFQLIFFFKIKIIVVVEYYMSQVYDIVIIQFFIGYTPYSL